MLRQLENGKLVTDLECADFDLRNVGAFRPVPPPLIGTDDPRLSDPRPMLDGSVFNISVADDAGIQQSKLNLNGTIPPNYLLDPNGPVTTGAPDDPLELVLGDDTDVVTVGGISQQSDQRVIVPPDDVTGDDGQVVISGDNYPPLHDYAARGDLVQYKAQKGQLNGYCPLDINGQMPSAFYPLSGGGSVNYVELSMEAFVLSPRSVDHGSVNFVALWDEAPAQSWFGTTLDEHPQFHTSPIPVSLIPDLPASQIGSGVFVLSRLPFAQDGAASGAPGIGTSPIAPGILSDPGAKGDPTDYVARDMTYKKMAPPPTYEPMVPDPAIVYSSGRISFTDSLADTSIFYRLDFTGLFAPAPAAPFLVDPGVTVEAYGAKIGYQNSNISQFQVPPR